MDDGGPGEGLGAPPLGLAGGAESPLEYLLAVTVIVGEPAQALGAGGVGADSCLGHLAYLSFHTTRHLRCQERKGTWRL